MYKEENSGIFSVNYIFGYRILILTFYFEIVMTGLRVRENMKFVVDEILEVLIDGELRSYSDLAQKLSLREEKIKEILKFLEEFDFVRIVDGKARIDTAVKRALGS